MTALLEIDGLSKSFGGLRAVNQLSFSVREREILGLIGPNGAGKSTVFNLINGVFPPDQGRVKFAGADLTGKPPYRVARHGLARTHQIVQPLTDLTVLENCTVGACFGRENLPLARARAVAREVAVFVGLEDRLATPAAQLTIAGKKRLELARALEEIFEHGEGLGSELDGLRTLPQALVGQIQGERIEDDVVFVPHGIHRT